MLKSKIDKLLERLEKEGKVTHLTDEEMLNIKEHIEKDMGEFREELRRKQFQSEMDTAKIILNA